MTGSFGAARHLDDADDSPTVTCARSVPDRDPELFWATVGGMGLTGVMLDASLRTIPVGSA